MLFFLSKVLWTLLLPGNLFFLALTVAAALLWSRWRRFGRRLLVVSLAAAAFVAIVPLGSLLVAPLEDRFPAIDPPDRVDGIIVLGGSVSPLLTATRGQPALNRNAERLVAFVELARRYPEARLVFTGGSASLFRQDLKESDVARRVFRQMGFDPARVEFESESRNTHENALFSRDLVRPQPAETWLLVTSARHMPRAWGAFEAAGWSTIPYPVDYTTTGEYEIVGGFDMAGGLQSLASGLHGWIGLAYYYALGRIDDPFPGPIDR